jgi:hypothetical protein
VVEVVEEGEPLPGEETGEYGGIELGHGVKL